LAFVLIAVWMKTVRKQIKRAGGDEVDGAGNGSD